MLFIFIAASSSNKTLKSDLGPTVDKVFDITAANKDVIIQEINNFDGENVGVDGDMSEMNLVFSPKKVRYFRFKSIVGTIEITKKDVSVYCLESTDVHLKLYGTGENQRYQAGLDGIKMTPNSYCMTNGNIGHILAPKSVEIVFSDLGDLKEVLAGTLVTDQEGTPVFPKYTVSGDNKK